MRKNIKKSDVVKYWFERGIRERKDGKKPTIYIMDVGEPSCWACYDAAENGITDSKASLDECYEQWNGTSLECCHIIPYASSGNNRFENIVLLCLGCHLDAPNVTNPEYMFAWIKNRRENLASERKQLQKWAKDFIPDEDFNNIYVAYEMIRVSKRLRNAFYNFQQQNSVKHFGLSHLNEATLYGLYFDFMREMDLFNEAKIVIDEWRRRCLMS